MKIKMHEFLMIFVHSRDYTSWRSQSFELKYTDYGKLRDEILDECSMFNMVCDVFVFEVSDSLVDWKYIECIDPLSDKEIYKPVETLEYFEKGIEYEH